MKRSFPQGAIILFILLCAFLFLFTIHFSFFVHNSIVPSKYLITFPLVATLSFPQLTYYYSCGLFQYPNGNQTLRVVTLPK